jgi:DNA mismatch repair protein MLH1
VSSQDATAEDVEMEDSEADDPEAWKAEAHITNANYQAKKMIFLLFINRKLLSLSHYLLSG